MSTRCCATQAKLAVRSALADPRRKLMRKGTSSRLTVEVCFWQIVLQNDFRCRSEEDFSRIQPERRILIQKTASWDSIIAHFSM